MVVFTKTDVLTKSDKSQDLRILSQGIECLATVECILLLFGNIHNAFICWC